jgi:hypothetical protein
MGPPHMSYRSYVSHRSYMSYLLVTLTLTDLVRARPCGHSNRRALTGSSRAAKYAGIKAATVQIMNPLQQINATSFGTIWAGISANWYTWAGKSCI